MGSVIWCYLFIGRVFSIKCVCYPDSPMHAWRICISSSVEPVYWGWPRWVKKLLNFENSKNLDMMVGGGAAFGHGWWYHISCPGKSDNQPSSTSVQTCGEKFHLRALHEFSVSSCALWGNVSRKLNWLHSLNKWSPSVLNTITDIKSLTLRELDFLMLGAHRSYPPHISSAV